MNVSEKIESGSRGQGFGGNNGKQQPAGNSPDGISQASALQTATGNMLTGQLAHIAEIAGQTQAQIDAAADAIAPYFQRVASGEALLGAIAQRLQSTHQATLSGSVKVEIPTMPDAPVAVIDEDFFTPPRPVKALSRAL